MLAATSLFGAEPEPVLTILNKEFDGTAAYRIDIDYPEQTKLVLNADAVTTVIDYDLTSTGKDFQMLVGASELNGTAWCGTGFRGGGPVIAGLLKQGCDPLDNFFSLTGANYGAHKMVIIQAPGDGWWVYIDGEKLGRSATDLAKFGEILTYKNVGNCDALTLGGISCPNAYRASSLNFVKGTVKSCRFYDHALTDAEREALTWDNLTATESTTADADPIEAVHPYGIHYPADAILSSKAYNRSTSSVGMTTDRGEQTLAISQPQDRKLYHNMMDAAPFVVKQGETVNPTFGYSSGGQSGYVFVDWNNDGDFTSDEMVSASYPSDINGKTFEVAADQAPGIYRVRFKVDKASTDPAGSTKMNNSIIYNNGVIVDAALMVMNSAFTVEVTYPEGTFKDYNGNDLKGSHTANVGLAFNATPAAGQHLDAVKVEYGFPKAESKWGNPTLYTVDLDGIFQNSAKIPANLVLGESLTLIPTFAAGDFVDPMEAKGYKLVWNDEFNEPDGSTWNGHKWTSTLLWPEPNAPWHKYNSDDYDSELRFIEGGDLVLRGMEKNGTWVTGCLNSRYRFVYQYGYLEANVLCEFQNGTFAGLWLMPEGFPGGNNVEEGVEAVGGWPISGEVDIWEAAKPGKAHHTIHFSKDDRVDQDNSIGNNGSNNVDYSRYNRIGFEWGPDRLEWFWNGESVFSVDKSDSRMFGKWPFDHPFFIILQQAVGNPDRDAFPLKTIPGWVYTTRFDYVRVYQKEGQTYKNTDPDSGIQEINMDVTPIQKGIYDLRGRKYGEGASLAPGIYIIDGRKSIVK